MKIFRLFLLLFLLQFFAAPAVLAQADVLKPVSSIGRPERIGIMPFPDRFKSTLPFGQTHNYTVNLRGNGQAIVLLKTVFSNTEEASLSAISFTFPQEPQNITVYQVVREPQCVSYRPIMEPLESSRMPYKPSPECEQYQEPDYLYGWGNTTYHKAKYYLNGSELNIELPKEIKTNGSGSLVMVYTLPRITEQELLGAYNFTFNSVKVKDSIQNIQVGISVDPDYYLKDAKGEINYQTRDASMMSAPPMMAMESGKGIASAQFDQFYNQIGQGTIVKSASNIQPNESFSVKGTYADNRAKLYGREIGIGAVVILTILVLAFGSLFIAYKKLFRKKDKLPDQNKPVKSISFPAIIGASFGSSLLILLYTAGVYILSSFFSQSYYYYNGGSMSMLIFIFIAVISLCVFSVLLFTPGVIIGIKNGIPAGISTLVLTIIWLIIYGIIITVIMFVFFQNPLNPSYPVQVMPMGAAGGVEYRAADAVVEK